MLSCRVESGLPGFHPYVVRLSFWEIEFDLAVGKKYRNRIGMLVHDRLFFRSIGDLQVTHLLILERHLMVLHVYHCWVLGDSGVNHETGHEPNQGEQAIHSALHASSSGSQTCQPCPIRRADHTTSSLC